jgi:hypothetical protein
MCPHGASRYRFRRSAGSPRARDAIVRIVCSGFLVRYPLGGHTWHHLQYLLGFLQLGHEVTYYEDHGWEGSCFDPSRDDMTDDPSYGVAYMERMFPRDPAFRWCYLAADGRSHGLPREGLAEACATRTSA